VSACDRRRTDGLEGIQQSGEIRIAVRPGFFDEAGAAPNEENQASLIRQLAARIGVKVRWVEPRSHDKLLEYLHSGRADLAVSRFSPGSFLDLDISASAPVAWVEDYLVVGSAMPGLTLEDLEGGEVHLLRSALSPGLESALAELGLVIIDAPEDLSMEELLEGVGDGRVPLTVADSALIEEARGGSIRLFGPIMERRPVVWGVRTGNRRLRRAVDDFLFADQVLARRSKVRACRDMPQIRQARVLRVLTRNSPTTCYVTRGGLEGFEYELAVEFARGERLRLELSIPPPGVDPLDWLEEGRGDMAILHEPIAPSRAGGFAISVPYRPLDLVSVFSRRHSTEIAVEDLSNRNVVASRPVGELAELMPFDPPVRVQSEGVDIDAFNALLAVARGDAFAAVVDRDAARLELDNRADLVLGPVVVPGVPLHWVFNVSSPELRKRADLFLRQSTSSGYIRQLARNMLGRWRPYVSPRLPKIPEGDLTPYDEYLKWAARRNGIDWRLLASLMYEESRFDPDAVGPGGSAGLFQLMPFTWRELGVEDPHHPGEAIEAGARYLGTLMDKFSNLELADQVAMAVASYNVGPRHVFDARRLAREMDFDPDRWSGSVETAMFILDDPEVARRFPAGVCRCRRGAAYTRRILRRYVAYTEQFPPE
jgi:membrane-bound lytic murein transglycosylase F